MNKPLIHLVVAALLLVTTVCAWAEEQAIPEQVPRDHWSCREIVALGTIYQTVQPLPEKPVLQRRELATAFLSILENAVQKCEAEGTASISSEERERLAALHEALKDDLAGFPLYKIHRGDIERLLTPEEPSYLYKAGVKGFLRGEGSGNYTYTLNEYTYSPGSGVGRLAYRIRPYLEWHPADYLEIEIEGQGYGFTLGHPRDSEYSLYEAYLELSMPEGKRATLKLGRQEFMYGSTFILGADAPHGGLTYDAARLRLLPLPELTLDLLGGSYAAPASHYFDYFLAGAYLTYTSREGTALETYYIHDEGPLFSLPREHLDIFGMRGTARFGRLALEIEPVYETGQRSNGFALQTIDAWGGHLDLFAEADIAGYRNTFTIGYAFGSGSQDAADGISARKEFSNPNSDTTLKGDLGFIGDFSGVTVGDVHGSGLQAVTAGWGINLTKNLNFSACGHYYWVNDTPAGISRHVGLETDFIITWNFADEMALVAAYDRLFTGGFFKDATGSTSDMEYGYLMLQFNLFSVRKKVAKK